MNEMMQTKNAAKLAQVTDVLLWECLHLERKINMNMISQPLAGFLMIFWSEVTHINPEYTHLIWQNFNNFMLAISRH